ncbi:MAG: gliding motility-associated C-terminal domain-containing protein [Flavobacteriales bacterium]|nr:gliding motility-associated C-terminal domain-containing protein [Bacteroidota bacterium]MCB9240582.1 gliding motility-associated C-terminal domain-containing protein [Flavobacteriales bacterium]
MNVVKGIGKYLSFAFLLVMATTAQADKWYVDVTLGDDLFDGQSPSVNPPVNGPFKHLAWAIQRANPMDTIYVAAGTYEENVNVDKAITIFGNSVGIPGTGTRNTESIIVPSGVDLDPFPNSSSSVIYITAEDVFIDGLVVDGNNVNQASGNDVRGSDVDNSYGMSNAGPFNNVWIQNCIFRNLNSGGVYFRGNVNQGNINCGVKDCYITNLGDGSAAIQLEGFYCDLIGNSVELTDIGVYIHEFRTSHGRSWQVSGNTIRAFNIGMQVENCGMNTSGISLVNNNITTVGASIGDLALYLHSNFGNFTITLNNNNYSNYGEAISALNNNLPPTLITNDTFVNCDFGLRLNNIINNNKVDTFQFNGCAFTNLNVVGVDAWVDSNRTDFIFSNTSFDNVPTAMLLRGNCHPEPNNSTFTDVRDYFIFLDDAGSNIRATDQIDATNCLLEGMTGTAHNDSMNFINEDKFRHYLDENRFAYINFKPMHAYISGSDGNIFMTPAVLIASDNWSIHLDTMNHTEDVNIDKSLDVFTRGEVSLGSFVMAGVGKTVTMHGDMALSNTLTLKDGIINTQSGVITVGQPQFAEPFNKVSGGGLTSYVDGPLRIVTTTKTMDTTYFPIGKGPDFRPIWIVTEATTTGNLGSLEAELNQGPAPSFTIAKGITHTSQIHHWRTNNMDGLSFSKVSFMGGYGTIVNDDEVTNPSQVRMVVESIGAWQDLGGSGTAAGNGIASSTNANQTMSFVSLANTAKGSNPLGKSGAIAAFDYQVACFPDSVQFTDISATTTGGIVAWHWDFGDGATTDDTSIIQNPKYGYPAPGTYDVQLIVINSNLDSDTVTRTIRVVSPPKAGYMSAVPCFPAAITLTDTSQADAADPIATWEWDVNGTNYGTSVVNHAFGATGTYSVGLKVWTQNGCVDSVRKNIVQGDTVKVSITPAGPIALCSGDSVTITANSNALSYQWRTGETTKSIVVNKAGAYHVTASNSNGCTDVDSVAVSVLPSPTANAGIDETIDFGGSVTLNGSGGGSYDWMPSGSLSNDTIANPVASPTSTTTYILRVYNSFGCESFDTVIVTVNPAGDFDVPNLLTPNDDGSNDVWDLSTLPGIQDAKVSIISRWGKQVFVSFNYQNDWNGTYNGEPVPEGTYLYIIENIDTFGVLKGSLLIIR